LNGFPVRSDPDLLMAPWIDAEAELFQSATDRIANLRDEDRTVLERFGGIS
jgi:hypothetical protein